MKPLRLKLRGSIGIKKGLGKEEIDIDLSNLSGLVAISGKTGSGKTTILEMLHPYAKVESRKGALSHQFSRKDSYKDLEFEFQGDHYRSLVKIDADSGRTEGYLWKNHADESMTDGKISNYNKVINELLDNPGLFFNSAFSAQNAKKLNELETGKIKELFSEFLKLDRIVAFEDTAKQCRNKLKIKKDLVDREIDSIKDQIKSIGWPAGDMLDATQDKRKYLTTAETLAESLKDTEFILAARTKAEQSNAIVREKAAHAKEKVQEIAQDIVKDREQEDMEVFTLRTKYKLLGLDIIEADGLLANEAEIKSAVKRVDDITLEIAQEEELLAAQGAMLREAIKKRIAADSTLAKETSLYEIAKTTCGKNNELLTQKLRSMNESVADLDKRDPVCVSTICSFIVSALSAKAGIGGVKKQLIEGGEHSKYIERVYSATHNEITTSIQTLMESEIEKDKAKEATIAKIAKMKISLKINNNLAADLSKVLGAQAQKESAKKQMDNISKEGVETKDRWNTRIEAKELQKKKAEGAYAALIVSAVPACSEDIDGLKVGIQTIQKSIAETTDSLAEVATRIAVAESCISQHEQAELKVVGKMSERAAIVAELTDWTYLADACGAKRLRALEIDAVTPVITTHANNMLMQSGNSAHTVKIRTQDETGKEVFDIIAIDRTAIETKFDNLSGGQKVELLKALRLGMTLISKEKSGAKFQAGFADELDGSLDVERAVSFVGMYRAFMDKGGFDQFFFISHRIECQSIADHEIHLEGGRIEIT